MKVPFEVSANASGELWNHMKDRWQEDNREKPAKKGRRKFKI